MEDFEFEEQDGGLPILTKKSSAQPAEEDGLPILKKKVDGNVLNNGTSNTSQSKLVSDLQSLAERVKTNPSKYTAKVSANNGDTKPIDDGMYAVKQPQVITPTNLPKSDAKEYELNLRTKDAILNTVKDTYEKQGKRFDEKSPDAKQAIQDLTDKEKNKDIAVVKGKDDKYYTTRGEGFLESAVNTLKHSFSAPFKAFDINKISDKTQLADALDADTAEQPNVPESAPAGLGGGLGEMAGGVVKPVALLSLNTATAGLGTSAMVGEAYYTALAEHKKQIYQEGLKQGLSREDAAQKALDESGAQAIPDAAMAFALSGELHGISGAKSLVSPAADASFRKAFVNSTKSVAKMAGLGAGAGALESGIKAVQGNDVSIGDAIVNSWDKATEYGKMDLGFKIAGGLMAAPKYLVSAAKEYLTNIPKPILDAQISEMGEDGQKIQQGLQSYQNARQKVEGLVPEEHISNFAGLIEKQDKIKQTISDLQMRKLLVPEPLRPKIDEQIAENQLQVDAIDGQMKKMAEVKDPSKQEIDDLTGQKVGVTHETVSVGNIEPPTEIPKTEEPLSTPIEKPSDEQLMKDANEGKFSTFTYGSDKEVPEIFKDKISSRGTTNGKEEIRVTVPQSLADYYLAKETPSTPISKEGSGSVELTYEEKKADIEKRRQEELDAVDRKHEETNFNTPQEKAVAKARQFGTKGEINDRYNSELSNLKDTTPEGIEEKRQAHLKKSNQDNPDNWGQTTDNEDGTQSINHTGKKFNDGMSVDATFVDMGGYESDVTDPYEMIISTDKPSIMGEDGILKKGAVVKVGKFRDKASADEWLKGEKERKIERKPKVEAKINAKYDSELEKIKEQSLSPKPIEGEIKNETTPTEVSKQAEGEKPIVEKVSEVKSGASKGKEYTTQNGKHKIVYDEKGNYKVINVKTGEEVSKPTAKKVINEAADNYDFSKGERAAPPEGVDFKNEKEADSYVVENSNNPVEVAEVFVRQKPEGKPISTIERMIAETGIGRILSKSFNRFGDKNNKGFAMGKHYLDGENARSIDVVADEMSAEHGVEITPQDIADFMTKFPNGESTALQQSESSISIDARNKFEKLTGLPLNQETAEKAINHEYNKLKKDEQQFAEQQFTTEKELEDAYYSQFAPNNAAKESNGSKIEPPKESNGNNKPPTDNTTSTNQDEGSGNTGVVGMTRAIMKQEKIDSNLTDAENLFIGSTDKKAWDNVNKKIEANPNLYQERVNATFGDALNGERPKVSDEDALIGLHEKVRLRVEHNEISQQIADAKSNGNNLDVVSLELQKDAIENKQIENKQFIKLVGSSGGKLLRSVGFLSGEDYSFAGLTHDIETEQGSKLTPEQKDRFKKLADEHSKLVKDLADLHEKIKVDEDKRSKDEEISRAKFEEDTIARLKIEAEKDKNKPSKPARNKEVVKAELDKAREQFRKDSQQLSSGGLQSIESFVKVVKLAVEYGVKSAAEFIKQFKDDFEGYSEQEIKDAYENVANPNNFQNLADKAAKLSEGELHEGMKPIIDKMLKAIVVDNPEITHVEATDKIYNALTDAIPNLNREEVRDLISGYGKYKLLNKEQVPTAIREIKTQNRLDAALDAVKEKNELPLRSGMERHEKTEATRKKEAEILRIIKEKGLTPELSAEDIDRQYKSAEATYQKRIENAISDIEREIETGEKKKKANPKEYNSERSKQLKDDLEKLKEIRDAKFSEPVKSAGEKKIDALRKKRDDILYKNESTPKKGDSFTKEEQAEIEKLNDEIFEAKKLSGKIKGKDFKTDAEKRVESENNKLENLKNKLDDLIAGKVKEKKINEPDSKEVKNLKEQIKAIEHPAKTAEEIASSKESAKEKATQKVIDDINKEIDLLKNGEVPEGEPTIRTKEGKQIFSFKKHKPDKITNDRIKELEALKENLQDEKSNLIPSEVKKQAIILKERTNRQRRLENLETQVKEGNYSPKPKPEVKPYDKQIDETNLKIKKLESIVANEKEKIRLSNRGKIEKTIDGLSKYQRFMIFLNPWGMGRLAYAAMFRPVMKVPTEMAKYALSKLPVTSRIMEKSIGMYRPTIGSAARATKNYYSTLIAKTTFKDALSEYNRRSNFSLRNDAEATDRYNGKLDFALSAPEMTHGFMKAFPKISAYESTYRAALENLNNTTDPRTGKPYDITDPTVRQIAIEEALRDAYGDVFMSQSELSNMSNKMLSGMASSENMAIQAAGLYGKQLQPVLRVPANFYHEVLQQLPVIGMLDAAQVVARSGETGAKKLNDGSYRGIDNLTPEQAHKAARAMVNQAVGLMMVGVGVALYKKYGDDLVKKIEEYKYWIHNTGLPLIMMGLGIGKDLKKGDGVASSITKNVIHTTIEETTKLPQLKAAGQVTKLSWAAAKSAAGKSNWDNSSKQAKEMLASLLIPAGAAELAKRMDDNKKRDPKTFEEILKMRIPGLRETVHNAGSAGAGGSWVRPK